MLISHSYFPQKWVNSIIVVLLYFFDKNLYFFYKLSNSCGNDNPKQSLVFVGDSCGYEGSLDCRKISVSGSAHVTRVSYPQSKDRITSSHVRGFAPYNASWSDVILTYVKKWPRSLLDEENTVLPVEKVSFQSTGSLDYFTVMKIKKMGG